MEQEGRDASAAGERLARSLAAATALSGPGGLGMGGLYVEMFPDGVLGGWDAVEGEVRMSGSASMAPERDSSCSDRGCSTPADECRWREELLAEGGELDSMNFDYLHGYGHDDMDPSVFLTPVYRVWSMRVQYSFVFRMRAVLSRTAYRVT